MDVSYGDGGDGALRGGAAAAVTLGHLGLLGGTKWRAKGVSCLHGDSLSCQLRDTSLELAV